MPSKAAKRRQLARERDSIQVLIPQRVEQPISAIADLGPTNSGKTHDALDFLVQERLGTFAAPLRMLALEGYEKIREQVGDDMVGLRTGEERINPDAPILCCTAELAPMRGHVLVLDEVHWAADSQRGFAWTRLLAGAEYNHLRLLGAPDALPLLRSCFGDRLQVVSHERLGPLTWNGAVTTSQLQPGDVIVAFSRRSVLYIAGQLARQFGPGRVAALYGAMPPSSRRAELRRVREGQADFTVATDVLGHGLNLPCRRILFAETAKFDGEGRRDLHAWEAAQIAGRAGRFGLHPEGFVGVLDDLHFFHPDPRTAKRGLTPKADVGEGLRGFREVTRGSLRPTLDDLNVQSPDRLTAALSGWRDRARKELAGHEWVRAEDITPLLDRAGVVGGTLRTRLNTLTVQQLWSLAISPIDPDQDQDRALLVAMARTLAGHRGLLKAFAPSRVQNLPLAEAETIARQASQLRWFAGLYPDHSDVSYEQAADLEERAASQVTKRLKEQLRNPPGSECRNCGRACAPWYQYCDRCAW